MRPEQARWALLALLLLGLALRLSVLVRAPFHQDEALYGFWGRLIISRDPWLATVPVDKPPLHLYLLAASQNLFGASRFAVRLPGLAASLLNIPLVYVLSQRLYPGTRQQPLAITAAAVMALSPYPLLFGAAALTDSLLVFWLLLACYAAVSGRWGWAGITLGLAFAAKQQALLWLVLLLCLGLPRVRGRLGLFRFGFGFALIAGMIALWEQMRIGQGAANSFWVQSVQSYGGLRLIWPAELAPRLRAWLAWLHWFWASPMLSIAFVGGLLTLLGQALWRGRGAWAALTDLNLIFFALFYLFLHWFIAFPVWDRYLLPLSPIVAILSGRTVTLIKQRRLRLGYSALLIVLLLASSMSAANSRIPIGGDHGAYTGLEPVIEYLRELPVGTVLYDRWLSWHYDFYLFDAYLYRAGFPSVEWLVDDVAGHYDGRPRYLVVPWWQSAKRLARQLGQAGFELQPSLTSKRSDGTISFTVYQISRSNN